MSLLDFLIIEKINYLLHFSEFVMYQKILPKKDIKKVKKILKKLRNKISSGDVTYPDDIYDEDKIFALISFIEDKYDANLPVWNDDVYKVLFEELHEKEGETRFDTSEDL